MKGQPQEYPCKCLDIDVSLDLSLEDEIEMVETREPFDTSSDFISPNKSSVDLSTTHLRPRAVELVIVQNQSPYDPENCPSTKTQISAICSVHSGSITPDDSSISFLKKQNLFFHDFKLFSEIDRVSFHLLKSEYKGCTDVTGFKCPLNALLVRLILRERFFQEAVRKEQIYKRVFNSCFKAIFQDFKMSFYPNNRMLKKAVKAEMIRFYFGADSIFLTKRKLSKSLSADIQVSNFSNINFNKKVMAVLSGCEAFRTALLEKISCLLADLEGESQKQLYKFLRECDDWVANHTKSSTPEQALLTFFDHKNRLGKKRGINIPWSVDQIQHACQLTASALNSQREKL